MKTPKTPQQKKQLSYERDHVVEGCNTDKGTRKSWPRKETRIERKFRRKVAQTVRTVSADTADDMDSAVRSITRQKAKKWGATPLGEAVTDHLQARVEREGRHKALHAHYDAQGITYPSQLRKPRKSK
ncbi:MAG: hypothetical protein RL088_3674 [Verrucomicrobiota bacterium]|jgi:hypothetical protein